MNNGPYLPNRILMLELAAHLRDADLSVAYELDRLVHVGRDLGLDLSVELGLLKGLSSAEARAGLDNLANTLVS